MVDDVPFARNGCEDAAWQLFAEPTAPGRLSDGVVLTADYQQRSVQLADLHPG
jgi:hypothetical protein